MQQTASASVWFSEFTLPYQPYTHSLLPVLLLFYFNGKRDGGGENGKIPFSLEVENRVISKACQELILVKATGTIILMR